MVFFTLSKRDLRTQPKNRWEATFRIIDIAEEPKIKKFGGRENAYHLLTIKFVGPTIHPSGHDWEDTTCNYDAPDALGEQIFTRNESQILGAEFRFVAKILKCGGKEVIDYSVSDYLEPATTTTPIHSGQQMPNSVNTAPKQALQSEHSKSRFMHTLPDDFELDLSDP